MPEPLVFDLMGIGIGPFNLGLAALCQGNPNFHCLFIDQKQAFSWHPGLMIAGTRLQVPFYADLVTLADPCSRFSYLAFLHAKNKLFRFAISEQYVVTRRDYNDYCCWVADQLPSLHFGQSCEQIEFDAATNLYIVSTSQNSFLAKHLVLGVGTTPFLPSFAANLGHPGIIHSGDYLFHKKPLLNSSVITIVGSGQSAAEIFYDLLNGYAGKLSWFTRASRLYPMDYSKFSLEMSTPDYIEHFYSLDAGSKSKVLSGQDALYKGINFSLLGQIYDALHERESTEHISIHPNCELKGITHLPDQSLNLVFHHREFDQSFIHHSRSLILATGYRNTMPNFIEPIRHKILWDDHGNYQVNADYSIDDRHRIFIQNAETHTHGFNAADLSLGPYRNAVILNSILGYEHYKIEKNTGFQKFGMPFV